MDLPEDWDGHVFLFVQRVRTGTEWWARQAFLPQDTLRKVIAIGVHSNQHEGCCPVILLRIVVSDSNTPGLSQNLVEYISAKVRALD